MSYLIDTDWIADYLKGRVGATTLLHTLRSSGIAISLITYGELLDGIYYGHNPRAHERVFRQFLRAVPVLPLNRRIMERFARIRDDLRRRGQIIGDPDILIGATALHHNMTLVTRNLKDYQRIPGLAIYQQP